MRYAPFLVASAFSGTWAQANENTYSSNHRRNQGYIPGGNLKVRQIERSLNVLPRAVSKSAHDQVTVTVTVSHVATQTATPSSAVTTTTPSPPPPPAQTSSGGASLGDKIGLAVGLTVSIGGLIILLVMGSAATGGCRRRLAKREGICTLPTKKLTRENVVGEVQQMMPEKTEQAVKEMIESVSERVKETHTTAEVEAIVQTFQTHELQTLADGNAPEGAQQIVESLKAEVEPLVAPLISLDGHVPETDLNFGNKDTPTGNPESDLNKVTGGEGDDVLGTGTKELEQDIEKEAEEGLEKLLKDADGNLVDAFGNIIRHEVRRRRAY